MFKRRKCGHVTNKAMWRDSLFRGNVLLCFRWRKAAGWGILRKLNVRGDEKQDVKRKETSKVECRGSYSS